MIFIIEYMYAWVLMLMSGYMDGVNMYVWLGMMMWTGPAVLGGDNNDQNSSKRHVVVVWATSY